MFSFPLDRHLGVELLGHMIIDIPVGVKYYLIDLHFFDD